VPTIDWRVTPGAIRSVHYFCCLSAASRKSRWSTDL
jgi:hypothetical protein